eukprot:CAMPEP_0117576080 /NCGR_PEP_ID=MMETSP0784-20121206/62589_1 /TAXON_ID=39447 /ORGANISM="" /LENGTH=39 /DNA_ID= /DNA_START= /DNA_END= /DNA_ORIENTATION=
MPQREYAQQARLPQLVAASMADDESPALRADRPAACHRF